MEHITQSINPFTPRDYDKDPIVIEDYNPLFQWLSFKYVGFIIVVIAMAVSNIYFSDKTFNWEKLLIMIPIASWPSYNQYKNTKGKRKIFLYKDKISYKHNDQIISEILFEQTPKFFRSFQNFYHKSQDRLTFWYLIIVFFMGWLITKSLVLNSLIFLIVFSITMLAFQITKWVISKSAYRFFHSILVIHDDEIIGVSLLNKNDYLKVEEYFSVHNIGINTLPIYHKCIYGYEKIEIE